MIDEINFFDQPIKSHLKTYQNILKLFQKNLNKLECIAMFQTVNRPFLSF